MAQSTYKREEKQAELRSLQSLYDKIMAQGDCVTVRDLAINGKDLMDMGIEQGPKIGEVLGGLLDKVLDDPALNTKDRLTELVKCEL